MAHRTLTKNTVWTDFRALSPESRVAFLMELIAADDLRQELEDAFDGAVMAERADEPRDPIDEVMEGIRARARVAVHG